MWDKFDLYLAWKLKKKRSVLRCPILQDRKRKTGHQILVYGTLQKSIKCLPNLLQFKEHAKDIWGGQYPPMSSPRHKMTFLYFWKLYNILHCLIKFDVSTSISRNFIGLWTYLSYQNWPCPPLFIMRIMAYSHLNFVISKLAMSTIIYNDVNGRQFPT